MYHFYQAKEIYPRRYTKPKSIHLSIRVYRIRSRFVFSTSRKPHQTTFLLLNDRKKTPIRVQFDTIDFLFDSNFLRFFRLIFKIVNASLFFLPFPISSFKRTYTLSTTRIFFSRRNRNSI